MTINLAIVVMQEITYAWVQYEIKITAMLRVALPGE